MTNQEAFNVSATHLLKQGYRCTRDGFPAYYGHGEQRCALGCFIPKDIYNPRMEMFSSDEIQKAVPGLQTVDLGLLDALQYIHDHRHEDTGHDELEEVACRYNLTMPRTKVYSHLSESWEE